MIRLLTTILILTSLTVNADTQVPHTFEDGEVISADEFNQNFDVLESAVDDILTGATGPQGPQGEQGPAGPQGEQGPAGADGVAGLGSPFVWQYSDSCSNLASGRFCQALGNNGPYLQFYASDAANGLWTVISNCIMNDSYIYDTYLVDTSDVASLVFWRAKSAFSSSSGGVTYHYIEQAGNSTVALPFSVDDTVALVSLGCTPPEPDPFAF